MQPTPSHRIFLTWEDVDQLIDKLIPQFQREFNAMVMITRGGTIPGGMLAESMGMTHILTAAVDFPATALATKKNMLMAWPEFIQFPAERQTDWTRHPDRRRRLGFGAHDHCR